MFYKVCTSETISGVVDQVNEIITKDATMEPVGPIQQIPTYHPKSGEREQGLVVVGVTWVQAVAKIRRN